MNWIAFGCMNIYSNGKRFNTLARANIMLVWIQYVITSMNRLLTATTEITLESIACFCLLIRFAFFLSLYGLIRTHVSFFAWHFMWNKKATSLDCLQQFSDAVRFFCCAQGSTINLTNTFFFSLISGKIHCWKSLSMNFVHLQATLAHVYTNSSIFWKKKTFVWITQNFTRKLNIPWYDIFYTKNNLGDKSKIFFFCYPKTKLSSFIWYLNPLWWTIKTR